MTTDEPQPHDVDDEHQEPERDPAAHLAIDLHRGRGTITVGGHDISSAVQALTLRSAAGDLPELELDLVFLTAAATATEESRVVLTKDTEKALLALGWKPPRPDLDGRDPDGLTPLEKLAYVYPDVHALVQQHAAATEQLRDQEQVIINLERELEERRAGKVP